MTSFLPFGNASCGQTIPAIDVNRKAFARDELAAHASTATTSQSTIIRTCRPSWWRRCPQLKHIVFLGTGAASYMNVAELNGRGIKVHIIKGYGDTAVAEHTVALIWARARDVARMDREVRSGVWTPQEGVQLLGKTLGVIGLGGIGAEVARIGKGLGHEGYRLESHAAAEMTCPAGRYRYVAGEIGCRLDEPRARRRDARLSLRGAHRAHEDRARFWSIPRAERLSMRRR